MTLPLKIGDQLREFSLPDTDGEEFSLEDVKNYELIVIFFTSNNVVSNYVTANMVEAYKEKVAFIGVNSVLEDTVEMMRKVVKKQNWSWIYLKDVTQEVAVHYKVKFLPHFFIFQNDGRGLAYTGRGIDRPLEPKRCQKNHLEEALNQLLDQKEVTTFATIPRGEKLDIHYVR